MYDIGIIPEASMGWRYAPSAAIPGDAWTQPKFADDNWLLGPAPFHYDRDLQRSLIQSLGVPAGQQSVISGPIYFRYEFMLADYLLLPESTFKMEIASTD